MLPLSLASIPESFVLTNIANLIIAILLYYEASVNIDF